ncbi:Vms1-associating treble clef domain-containing protein [Phytophthora infestans]|uniref:Vms1-associating treble clef domain-containing protein n=1 Tax=Phytophthora infestans TaxID=4787 RepID=A0A8S9USG4_PHYIN|nr:Vms1-associating treble clef domain-containing protein [Phytophthora infestans]
MIRGIRELIAPEDVGLSLPHEHVLHNIGAIIATNSSNVDLEIRFEDLIDYRHDPFAHGGRNLLMQKEDEAFRELERLQQLKRNKLKPLIVDVTLPGEGRDVCMKERLQLAERLKNLHVLTVTTFEIEKINEKFTVGLSTIEQSERIAKTLEAELMFGVESGNGVAFPGAIYQLISATSGELNTKEQVLVQGLALAQVRTHAPLYLSFSNNAHSDSNEKIRVWIRALLDAGAERKKLVVCHAERWCQEGAQYAFLLELVDLGVSILFSSIGLLAVSDVVMTDICLSASNEDQEPRSDSHLAKWIANLVKANPKYCSQLLLSTNVHQRIQYRRYGGGGYTYLFDHFKPRFLRRGVSEAQWEQIVRSNVVDLLAWYEPPEAPPIPKNYLQCSICANYFEPIEGEYFTKFTFIYCGTKCLRRHSRQKFAPLPLKT